MTDPALGSGALREALERLRNDIDASRSCGLGGWPDQFATRLDEVEAALSLSSPIEPSKEQLKDACEVCETCGFHCIDRRTEQVRKLFAPTTAQASSEIREVERIAQEMCRLAAEMHHTASGYAYQKLGEYGKQILDALSPSRQGAGGEKI